MRCRTIRRWLVEFATDGIDPARQDAFAEHLAVCPRCAAEWRTIEEADRLLAALPAPAPEESWIERLTARVEASLDVPPAPAPRPRFSLAAAGAVALLLLGIGFGLRWRPERSAPSEAVDIAAAPVTEEAPVPAPAETPPAVTGAPAPAPLATPHLSPPNRNADRPARAERRLAPVRPAAGPAVRRRPATPARVASRSATRAALRPSAPPRMPAAVEETEVAVVIEPEPRVRELAAAAFNLREPGAEPVSEPLVESAAKGDGERIATPTFTVAAAVVESEVFDATVVALGGVGE